MTAPDGRKFTQAQWFDYSKEHNYDTSGEIYCTIEGFKFNVHGYCFNPHTIDIALPDERTYVMVRTFKTYLPPQYKTTVWAFSNYSMNCNGGGSTILTEAATEKDAIVAGLRSAISGLERDIEWLENAVANAKRYDSESVPHYTKKINRTRKMRDLVIIELEKNLQYTLF